MEMFIKQTIHFEMRGHKDPGRSCIPKTDYFHNKTQNSRQIFKKIII